MKKKNLFIAAFKVYTDEKMNGKGKKGGITPSAMTVNKLRGLDLAKCLGDKRRWIQ